MLSILPLVSYRLRALTVLGLILMLSGCSATGPQFSDAQAAPNEALVYVYRPSAGTLRARTAIIEAAPHASVRLSNNGHVLLRLPPGPQRFSQVWAPWLADSMPNDRPISQQLDLQPGQRYFLRLSAWNRKDEKLIVIRWQLEEVPAAQALEEIAKTRRD